MAIHANSTAASVVHPGLLPPGATLVPTPSLTAETRAMLAAIPAELPPLTAAFSRRRAIFGSMALAALPLASVPVLASAAPTLDPVFAAIEKHRLANTALMASFDRVAHFVRIPNDLEEAHQRASAVEREARYDMHQAVPTTFAGLKAYVAYWQAHISVDDVTPEEIRWEALATIAEALEGIAHV